jgi:hypothetical protein
VAGGTEIHIVDTVMVHVPSMRHDRAQLRSDSVTTDSVAHWSSLQISQVDVVDLLCVCAVDHVHAAHVVAEVRVRPRRAQHQVDEAVAVEVRGVAHSGAEKVGSGGAVKADNRVLGVFSEVDVLHVLRAVDQVRSAGPCPAFRFTAGAADQQIADTVTIHVARAADGGAQVVTSAGSSDHHSSSIEIVSEVDVDHSLRSRLAVDDIHSSSRLPVGNVGVGRSDREIVDAIAVNVSQACGETREE